MQEDEQVCAMLDLPEDYFTKDHDAYVFIAADSGMMPANQHIVHAIRFRDFADHPADSDLFA